MEARHRVLIVDEDEPTRLSYGRALVEAEYECVLAASCDEARALLAERDYSLAICGLRISGDSGLDLIRALRGERPGMAVLVASAEDDPMLAEIASDNGAYGYLVAPLSSNELLIGVANALYRRRLQQQNDLQLERLQVALEDRSAELRAVIDGLRSSQEKTVQRLSQAVEMRDRAGEQVERIGDICAILAGHLGLSGERVELLRIAAPMHDVGKVGVPDRILLKPGELTAEERREMERHTQIGHDLLQGPDSELMTMAALIALTHHERFDGNGYPRGLVGEEIPLEGRIAAVADVFGALISDRAYRPAFSLSDAIEMLRRGRGTQFDPAVLDALLENLDAVVLVGGPSDADPAPSRAVPGLDPLPPAPLAAPGVRHPEGQ